MSSKIRHLFIDFEINSIANESSDAEKMSQSDQCRVENSKKLLQ